MIVRRPSMKMERWIRSLHHLRLWHCRFVQYHFGESPFRVLVHLVHLYLGLELGRRAKIVDRLTVAHFVGNLDSFHLRLAPCL